MTRRRSPLACGLGVLALLAGSVVLPTSPAAAEVPAGVVVEGAACLPAQGVTVVVDFTPAQDVVRVGCAVGAQPSMAAAGAAAGFAFDPAAGYVCAIDAVVAEPAGCSVWPGAYWSIYTSTTDGTPSGPAGTGWTFAEVGINAGPAPVGSALLFQIQPFVPNWIDPSQNKVPLVALADVAGYQGNAPVDPPAHPGTADGDALLAAGWLGRQLADGGGVLPSPFDPSVTDWGLTIDALLALAAAGVGGDQIDATAAALWNSGSDFIGDPVDQDWSRVAKMVLALQVAGLDPTAFPGTAGPRNLIDEVRATRNADGSFGDGDFPFTHSLALYALARTQGGVPARSVQWLQERQCTDTSHVNDGAYGFSGCEGVDVDGTALTVQALLAAGVPASDPSVAGAVAWMIEQQQRTGGGGLPSSFGGANTNGSGLGGQALLAAGESAPAALASAYIGGLQISCPTHLADADLVRLADVGAIGYDAASWTALLTFGIDDVDRDQWIRATAQALLGLGLPAMGEITAAGAAPALPAAPTCAPPTGPVVPGDPSGDNPPGDDLPVDPGSPVDPPVGSGHDLPGVHPSSDGTTPTSTRPVLSATGVDATTGPTVLLGGVLLLLGLALMVVVRTRTAHGRHRG